MENMVHIKNSVLAALAAVGAFIAKTLGGWDAMMKLLAALMCLDILTGWWLPYGSGAIRARAAPSTARPTLRACAKRA